MRFAGKGGKAKGTGQGKGRAPPGAPPPPLVMDGCLSILLSIQLPPEPWVPISAPFLSTPAAFISPALSLP